MLAGCSDLVALEQRLRGPRGRDGRAARRRGAARPLRARPGPPRARRRLELARAGARAAARPRLRGRRSSTATCDASPAASSRAPRSRARWPATPTCCCSTSPPTTSTSPRSSGSRATSTGLDAAVILVAHDRWFLEAVGTSVLELEAGRARFFPGPWHAWRRELAAREIALGKAIEKQQREIARMERFVERFRYKATKARQAQSRVKRLEQDRAHRARPARHALARLQLRRGGAHRPGRARARGRRGSRCPAARCSRTASSGSSAASTCRSSAPTASGKTTLIEALAGRRPLDGGRLRTGHNVKLGYLSQHAEELGSTRHGARGRPARHRPHARQGARPARPLPVLGRGGREAARRACPAASAAGSRSRSWWRPAPTS